MDNYFGGASQFAGGGFLPSPAAGNANQYGGEARNFKKSSHPETIRAVTVRQLLRDVQGGSDENETTLDGAHLALATLVGQILDVSETATKTNFKIHDGTGVLDVMMHAGDDDELSQARKRELQQGVYVRIYGSVRRNTLTGNQISLQAINMQPIEDFNQIAYHNLQAIFHHLHITRGGHPATAGGMPGTSSAAFGGQAYGQPAMAGGGYGAGGMPAANAGPRTGDPIKDIQQVFVTSVNAQGPNGLNPNEVQQILNQQGIHYSMDQIRDTINTLANEGHVYSTIDEHYKAA